jgi:hypothetical protein
VSRAGEPTDDDYKAFNRKLEIAARDAIILCRRKMEGEENVSGAVLQILSDAIALVIITCCHPQTKEAMVRMAEIWGAEIIHTIEQQLKK